MAKIVNFDYGSLSPGSPFPITLAIERMPNPSIINGITVNGTHYDLPGNCNNASAFADFLNENFDIVAGTEVTVANERPPWGSPYTYTVTSNGFTTMAFDDGIAVILGVSQDGDTDVTEVYLAYSWSESSLSPQSSRNGDAYFYNNITLTWESIVPYPEPVPDYSSKLVNLEDLKAALDNKLDVATAEETVAYLGISLTGE